MLKFFATTVLLLKLIFYIKNKTTVALIRITRHNLSNGCLENAKSRKKLI